MMLIIAPFNFFSPYLCFLQNSVKKDIALNKYILLLLNNIHLQNRIFSNDLLLDKFGQNAVLFENTISGNKILTLQTSKKCIRYRFL